MSPQQRDVLPGMNAGASLSAVPSPIEGSGTAWVLLGSWALSPARPTPIPPRHECRGFSALLVTGAIKVIAAKSYRQRYQQSTGRDPLRCPYCQQEMGVWKVWHPKYGVVYDELGAIKRGRYESPGKRAYV